MDQIKIGKLIASERKIKGYTQKELAMILGVSDKTISKWETGKGFPEISLLMPLCHALDLDVNELLSGERLVAADYKQKAEENIVKLVQETQKIKKQKLTSLWNTTGNIIFFCVFVPLFLIGIIFLFFNAEISYPFIINSLIWMVLTLACKMKEQYDKQKAIKLKTNGISYQGRVVRICPVHWIRIGNYIASRIECIYEHHGEEKTVMSGIYLLTAFDKSEDFCPMIYCDKTNEDYYIAELYK